MTVGTDHKESLTRTLFLSDKVISMSYASEKIVSLRKQMEHVEVGSPQYVAYLDIIDELERVVKKENPPQIVVHKSVEPEICESCQ